MEAIKTSPKKKRKPEINTIIKKETLAERIDRYLIYAPHIAAKALPGQFVIVRLSDRGERVPLTICDKDIQNGTITLVVQSVGKSTAMMADMQEGDRLNDVLGPLGNASEIKNFGNVVVVGGGFFRTDVRRAGNLGFRRWFFNQYHGGDRAAFARPAFS